MIIFFLMLGGIFFLWTKTCTQEKVRTKIFIDPKTGRKRKVTYKSTDIEER